MGSQQKQPDFLVGFANKKDNSYLSVIMGVSGVFNPRMQLIDALIESYEKAFALTIGIARSPGGLATTER